MSLLTHLECSACARVHEKERLVGLCTACGRPLLARYDAARLAEEAHAFHGRGLWRYRALLPPAADHEVVTLGEGGTPLLPAPRLAERFGLARVLVKDEGSNPTGTFKARGMAVAVTEATRLGAKVLAAPTAGNAGGALAAYGRRAGVEVHVAMPRDAPRTAIEECERYGAHVDLVEGVISDAGKFIAVRARDAGWFDLATFKEPFRVEGKKTMGLELWEEIGVPDVVVYPTGGGTGLVGIVKAYDELEDAGLVGAERPRMVAVQAENCAPVVKALAEGRADPEPWKDPKTAAAGLRVPSPLAGPLIVDAVRRTAGTGVTVSDDAMRAAQRHLLSREGIWACLEGAATLAGLERLVEDAFVDPDETVVLLNTGAGWKD